jgi:hypothetical protein
MQRCGRGRRSAARGSHQWLEVSAVVESDDAEIPLLPPPAAVNAREELPLRQISGGGEVARTGG